jgi:phosphoribosylaminoimidazole (AIR) synthetase
MKEQTIKITINGEDREVLAGNAALLRFRKAGGDMSLISSIDGEDTDALFDSIDAICNLISINLVEPMTSDDVANGVETMTALFEAATTLLNQVPWLVGSN